MAIHDQGGRFQSDRSIDELSEMFEADLKYMTEEEREAFKLMVQDYVKGDLSVFKSHIEQSIYKAPPVDMETFLRDPHFLGQYGESIYSSIKKDLGDMFDGFYNEVIYGGAIGIGKSTLGKISLLRMLYEASCLRNPYKTYNVATGDKIAFLAISVTKYRAQEVILQDVIRTISTSPYFMAMNPKIKADEVIFPNGLWLAPGASTEQMTIGLNCFGCVMDEINFFSMPKSHRSEGASWEQVDRAEAIYNSIKIRMKSRFMKSGGRVPGMIVILSSKKALNSFTERRIAAAKDDPNIFVRERALWEVKGDYCGDTFRVAVGTDTKMSRLMSIGEPNPEDMKVINVPIEFGKDFETDIDRAIRDIAGFATPSITPFIQRRDRIMACINTRRQHPFTEYVWVQDKPGTFLWSEMVERKNGELRPKLNPMAPRHIHIDLSKSNDATGISMVHVGGYKKIQRIGESDDALPIYVVDFSLQIQPATHGEIIQSEIRRIIYEVAAHGYFIKLITCDTYQSLGMIQALKEHGFNADTISVDKTNDPYVILKQALYEGRMDYYRYEPLLKELRELEKNHDTGKVDHPMHGSKDVSDSLAGAVFTLSKVAVRYEESAQGAMDAAENEFEEAQEEAWVLDGGTVPINELPSDVTPEWRKEAARKIGEQSLRDQQDKNKYNNDWKKNFDLPFEIG